MAAEARQETPDFLLPSDSWDSKVSRESARRDGPVVLFFYPGDWSRVCTHRIGLLQEEIKHFGEKDATVLGVGIDSPWLHRVWPEERDLRFPLLSDSGCEVVEEPFGDRPEVQDVFDDLEKALQ